MVDAARADAHVLRVDASVDATAQPDATVVLDAAVTVDAHIVDATVPDAACINNDSGFNCCDPTLPATCALCFSNLNTEEVCETGGEYVICISCGYMSSL